MMKYVVGSFVGAWLLAVASAAGAQSLAYNSGQNVAPAYEGWEEDADGTKYFLFGQTELEENRHSDWPRQLLRAGPGDQGAYTSAAAKHFCVPVKVPAGFTVKDS
jgi:hypothetical protein